MPNLTYHIPNDDIHIPTIYEHLKDGVIIVFDSSLDDQNYAFKVQDLFTENNQLFLKLNSTSSPHIEYFIKFDINPKTNLTIDFNIITKQEFFTNYQSTFKNYGN